MTDATTTQPAADSTPAKKPVVELVTERRCFATMEAAGTALATIANDASDFTLSMLATPGASFDDEGNFVPTSPEWTADGYEIMLAPLATKAQTDGKGNVTRPARLIALVLCPIPTVQLLLSDSKAAETLADVWRKEANHRAVRKLRTAENVQAAVSEMPLSLESFVTAQTGAGSGLKPFDDHWLTYSQAMAEKIPAWGLRFPNGQGKAKIRSAIENAAKAAVLYPELESFGPKGVSLFEQLLKALISRASAEAQPVNLLESWMETRRAQTFETETAEGEVDFDSLFDDLEEDDGEDEADTDTDTDTEESEAPAAS